MIMTPSLSITGRRLENTRWGGKIEHNHVTPASVEGNHIPLSVVQLTNAVLSIMFGLSGCEAIIGSTCTPGLEGHGWKLDWDSTRGESSNTTTLRERIDLVFMSSSLNKDELLRLTDIACRERIEVDAAYMSSRIPRDIIPSGLLHLIHHRRYFLSEQVVHAENNE